jgi:hypothetical protein
MKAGVLVVAANSSIFAGGGFDPTATRICRGKFER